MKYISEEDLRKKGRFYMPDSVLQEFISNECTELDHLTVSKLRPMSEAPRDGTEILITIKNGVVFYIVYWDSESWVGDDGIGISDSNIDGWIPMPIYKPER